MWPRSPQSPHLPCPCQHPPPAAAKSDKSPEAYLDSDIAHRTHACISRQTPTPFFRSLSYSLSHRQTQTHAHLLTLSFSLSVLRGGGGGSTLGRSKKSAPAERRRSRSTVANAASSFSVYQVT
jgi:hypothetical protein